MWGESEAYIANGQAYNSVVKSGSIEAFKATTYNEYQQYLNACYDDRNLKYHYNAAKNLTLYCVSGAKTCDGDPIYSINAFQDDYCSKVCAWETEQEKCNAGKSFLDFQSAWLNKAPMLVEMTGSTLMEAQILVSKAASYCWANPHEIEYLESIAGMPLPCMGPFEADGYSLCSISTIEVASCLHDPAIGCELNSWLSGGTCGPRKLPPGCSVAEVVGSTTNTILGKANDVIASDDNIILGQGNSVQGKMLQQSTYIRTRYFGSASSNSASFVGALGNDTFAGGTTISETASSSASLSSSSSTLSAGTDASSTASTSSSEDATTAGGAGASSVIHRPIEAGTGASPSGAAGGTNGDGGASSIP